MVLFDEPDAGVVDACIDRFRQERHGINVFCKSVHEFFAAHPALTSGELPVVHSVRSRIKDESHLREKIRRKKIHENRVITPDNLFEEVTDLAGVRVLHLYMAQFEAIHTVVDGYVSRGHWCLNEPPCAYTWDPESSRFLERLGLKISIKESNYTSVHYVVKPNENVPVACEVQVRTLFEEVWGEIDHVLNYPVPTKSVACAEQLKVLAKMVGAGSRLAAAIFRSHGEYEARGDVKAASMPAAVEARLVAPASEQ
jgi:ppGpp synthetase/RelA/SpoT-type nucleotidyltranferase